MTSQLIIKSVLLVCVAGIGWMMLRSPGGARHQAGRRLVTLAFAIVVPSLTAHLARFVGVGRGADLLLYTLVIAFLAQVLSSFRRDARRERQITHLARRIALDTAPDPKRGGAGRKSAPHSTRD